MDGDVCVHLQVPVFDVIHVSVLPPVQLPPDVEEIALNE